MTVTGRERERARLDSFLANAAPGASLVLVGDPGIGKTTLWRVAVESARQRGRRVLVARPGEQETGLALVGLADLFDAAAATLPNPERRVIEQLAVAPPDAAALARTVLAALRSLAAAAPVLVAIDDVQWLDEASAGALRFALRRIGTEPVAVIATARRREGIAALDPERVEEVGVAAVTEDELDELLRAHLGQAFLRPVLRRLHRASAGNPFFALELARSLRQGDVRDAPGAPLPFPASLKAVVGRRVRGLSPELWEALVAVAAAAQPTPALVEAALGPAAAEALRGSDADGLLEVDRGRLRFTHPLLRSAVYSEAPAALKRSVHARLAELVGDPAERAAHVAAATALPDAAVAAELEQAASLADAGGAPGVAAALLEEALRLTPDEARHDRTRRALAAADRLWQVGEAGRARALLQDLLAAVPAGADRAHALRRFARLEAYELGFPAVTELLADALVCADGEPALQAAIERDLAATVAQFGSLADAAAHARRALVIADRLGDGALTREVTTQLEVVEFLRGEGEPADLERRALEGSAQPSLDSGLLPESMMLASILKWTDRRGAARAALQRIRAALGEREQEGALAPIAFHLGELECWAGDLDAAERLARESRDAAERSRQRSTQALGRYLAALVAAWRGDEATALAQAEAGRACADMGSDLRHVVRNLKVIGLVHLARGDGVAAAPPLGRAYELARGVQYRDPGFYRLEPDVVEAYVMAGRSAEAETVTAEFAARAERLARPWALAGAARARALVVAALGDPAAAVEHAAVATELARALDEPPELARSLLVQGTLERRARRKRDARTSLEAAAAIFDGMGAAGWLRRAHAELARIGGRAPAPGGLTPTERRVAELVVSGRPNKQVAAELHLSVKTVEANLSRIYRKLEVASRGELAARFTRADS